MLANMVAERYTSIYDVDWVEMARSINQPINQSNLNVELDHVRAVQRRVPHRGDRVLPDIRTTKLLDLSDL